MALLFAAGIHATTLADVPTSERSVEVRNRLLGTSQHLGPLALELAQRNHQAGDAVFFRIFKQRVAPSSDLTPGGKGVLELWVIQPSGRFELFKNYLIEKFSGMLGPKQKEGDRQAPEGFYGITTDLMNPNSNYHLAMNVGYPNALDTQLGRTGQLIMIHGKNVSAGCFAMTDPGIEQIYVMAEAALNQGQAMIPVHIFPFPLTPENTNSAARLPWANFWLNLAEGFELFENDRVPPLVSASDGRYWLSRP